MRVAAAVKLSDEQREQLEKQARARSVSVRLAQRSKMILLAALGAPDLKIAAELGVCARPWPVGAVGFCGRGWRASRKMRRVLAATTDLRQAGAADRPHDYPRQTK